MKPSEPAAQPTCTVVGILDDGWHGLSGSARDCLRAAALVIGVERTLQLVRPELAANCELRPLDGALAQCPGWIRDALAAGRSVAVLATGDPLCHGIGSSLIDRLPGLPVTVLPAPSTLQIACARFGKAWQDVKIASCHSQDAGEWIVGATPGHGLYPVLRAIALHRRVFVFTSPANDPARLARALLTVGHGDELRLSVASRLLLPDETLHPGLSAAQAATTNFVEPSVVLVERDELPAEPAFGREDDDYLQRTPANGLITKLEARAVSLAKLRLTAAATVWDIGAGSGSVGLECARLAPHGHVWAIEKNAADAAIARANAARLRIGNYTLIRRPDRLARPGRGVHWRFRRRTQRADPPRPRPPATRRPAGDEFRHPREPGHRDQHPAGCRRRLAGRPAAGQSQPADPRPAPAGGAEPGLDRHHPQP